MKRINKKLIICAAVAVAVTMGGSFSGCVTINEEDVKQVVSTVNITKSDKFTEEFGSDYAKVVEDEKILKRDLISAFLSTGYSYVQNGSTYAETFDALSEALVENAVVVQYSVVYLLKSKSADASSGVTLEGYLKTEAESGDATDTEIARYEYLLGGTNSDEVKSAKYNLYYSLNSALDNYEESYIDEEEGETYTGTDTRTTPGNVDTVKDDYISDSYYVYTGYTGYLLSDAGDEYEPLDGTSRNTRRKAYSSFVSYLDNNYLLTDDDAKNSTDILKLSYVKEMYAAQLQNEIVDAFGDLYEDERESIINATDDGVYTYISERYNKLLSEQTNAYDDATSFESALSSRSATSFVLYSPATDSDTDEKQTVTSADGSETTTYGTYGFVYNILLPFSTKQEGDLTNLQYLRDNSANGSDSNYFYERNQLLQNITTTDQRSAWFNGSTDYSFNVKEYNEENTENAVSYYGSDSGREYLFFKNNVTNSGETGKYEELERYIGLYSYNGKVYENEDGSYTLVPQKLTIDDMLSEFSAYIDFVLGSEGNVTIAAGDSLSGGSNFGDYYNVTTFYTDSNGNGKQDSDEETDYSKLVYATGKVNVDMESGNDMFVTTSTRYKVMSAVNELQYAYTTDTSVLSNYIGYSVSAYDTSYIEEFEYAAQEALRMGVGSFKVCAGDYGWHLIYVTETYTVEGGAAYTPDFTKERIDKEGTFENLFYNWIKDSDLTNEITLKRSSIIREYSTDDTVSTDTDVYKDLSELDNE